MSQQFQADARQSTADVNIPTTTTTGGPITSPIPVAFQNAKAKGFALMIVTVGTGTASLQVFVQRNPAAENVTVGAAQNYTVTAGQTVVIPVAFTDAIPDGRSVSYQAYVTQNGATANGTIKAGSYIEATLLSG